MAGFFIAMLFGVALFCGGVLFERYSFFGESEEHFDGESGEAIDPGYLKQWENLLNYDGSGKEEKYED